MALPSLEYGYRPPIEGAACKVKNPNETWGYGWPDQDGRVWVLCKSVEADQYRWKLQCIEGFYKNIWIIDFDDIKGEQGPSALILTSKKVKFNSPTDEAIFFEWISKIECIDAASSQHDELYLHIACRDLHDQDLRELLALFYRYKIEMKQLSIFLNENNKWWFFENKIAYWYAHVFKK